MNNVGIAGSSDGPPSGSTAEQMREVYETNVFGAVTVTVTVTNAMLPLLRLSGG